MLPPNCPNSLCSGGFLLLPMIIHSRTLTWCSNTSMFPFLGKYHLDKQIFCNNLPKLYMYIFRPYLVPIVVLCLWHVTPSIMPKVHGGHILVWGDVQWVWHICYCGGNNAGVSCSLIQILSSHTYPMYLTLARHRYNHHNRNSKMCAGRLLVDLQFWAWRLCKV